MKGRGDFSRPGIRTQVSHRQDACATSLAATKKCHKWK